MHNWALIIFFATSHHRLKPVYQSGFSTQAQCELAGRAAGAKYWYCGEVQQ